MKRKEQFSDEEIRSYMNFDRLLENRNIAIRSSRSVKILTWASTSLTIVGLIAWLFMANETEPSARSKVLGDSVNNLDHMPAKIKVDTAAVNPKEQIPLTDTTSDDSNLIAPSSGIGELDDTREMPALKESVYIQAEPVNGYAALYDYFNSNLIYPAEALKDSIQGIQTLSFIINADGRPEKIEVVESLGDSFEKESRRLIANMPEWKPATLNGKPVPSKIAIPLTFQIKKIKQ